MSAKIVIDRSEVLVDEPVGFTVEGCTPGEPVALTASWEIGQRRVRTEAHFVAPANGVVEPATQGWLDFAVVERCRAGSYGGLTKVPGRARSSLDARRASFGRPGPWWCATSATATR